MEDSEWTRELVTCLGKQPQLIQLKELCRGRKIPPEYRHEVWKIALNVVGKPDALAMWDGMLDTEEQDVLKEDCVTQASKLKLLEEDEDEVARDMEGLITFYCKSKSQKYRSSSGLVELLSPFIALELSLSEVYNCLYSMLSRCIPRECYRDGTPFHLFRQLLQYHDPQLCSFLDSRKIPPDTYAQKWLRGLFVATCEMDVIRAMWDIYFLEADPYFVFYLMLVIVMNAKDQILELSSKNRSIIIDMISNFPSQLGVEDIEDFCTLAQYYASITPQSYRMDFQPYLFSTKPLMNNGCLSTLCLQVSITEFLEATSSKSDIHFFLVDCRPAEQYNNGHLPTAFHLDANLMLQAPTEFSTAIEALFSVQQQAIDAGASAGGDHLCFIGSGREAEDQYVNMVVANFLQRGTHFVSIASGGYHAIHEAVASDLSNNLVDHNSKNCIVCNPDSVLSSEDESGEISNELSATPDSPKGGIVEKLSTSLRSRGANVKERFGKLMSENQTKLSDRHVSSADKIGRRYRDGVNLDIFSIEDNEDTGSSDDESRHEAVNIDTWKKRRDVIKAFPCSEISASGHMFSSYMLLTSASLLVLREIVERPGWATVHSRPHLSSIVKITSKRKHPDLITFRYGTANGDDLRITGAQKFLMPNSKNATKVIKETIMNNVDE